jgi:hypothetical protein
VALFVLLRWLPREGGGGRREVSGTAVRQSWYGSLRGGDPGAGAYSEWEGGGPGGAAYAGCEWDGGCPGGGAYWFPGGLNVSVAFGSTGLELGSLSSNREDGSSPFKLLPKHIVLLPNVHLRCRRFNYEMK